MTKSKNQPTPPPVRAAHAAPDVGWLTRLGRALSRVPDLPDPPFTLEDRQTALSRLSSRPESLCTSGA